MRGVLAIFTNSVPLLHCTDLIIDLEAQSLNDNESALLITNDYNPLFRVAP